METHVLAFLKVTKSNRSMTESARFMFKLQSYPEYKRHYEEFKLVVAFTLKTV